MSETEEQELIDVLRRNTDFFAWGPSYMHGIDIKVVCHCLAIDSTVKPIAYRKHKVSENKIMLIDEEVGKLKNEGFIIVIKYPTWITNMVLILKAKN